MFGKCLVAQLVRHLLQFCNYIVVTSLSCQKISNMSNEQVSAIVDVMLLIFKKLNQTERNERIKYRKSQTIQNKYLLNRIKHSVFNLNSTLNIYIFSFIYF